MLIARIVAVDMPRNPKLHGGIGHRESPRHDPDDPEGPALDENGPPHRRGVAAEALHPHAVREDDHRVGTDGRGRRVELRPPRFLVRKGAADRGRNAKQIKEAGGDLGADYHLGLVADAHRTAHRVVAGDAFEGGRTAPPVGNVASCRTGAIHPRLRVGLENTDEPIGVRDMEGDER